MLLYNYIQKNNVISNRNMRKMKKGNQINVLKGKGDDRIQVVPFHVYKNKAGLHR